MDLRRENMAPELKDVQNSCSWIPPAKPDSTTQRPICSDGKEKDIVYATQLDPERYSQFKQDNHTNWLETGRLLNNLLQKNQCMAIPTCYDLTNSVNVHRVSNTLQASQHTNSQVHGENLCINDKFSIDNDIWNNLSFGNLLAVAHAVGTPTSVENVVMRTDSAATSGSLATSFHPQINLSFGNLFPANLHSIPGAKSKVELNSLPQMLTGEISIPTMTMCNLHSPTRTNTNSATVKSVVSPFEPLTPEKPGKAGWWQESTMPYLSKVEMHIEADAQVNKILSDEVKELQAENKQSQLCATNSTQLPENHKPDKEGAEETDLRETPNLKPRKKRIRPKVKVEGQPKKTPKPSTENQAFSAGTTKVERKYVRRKGANNLNNTPLEGRKSQTDSNKSPPKPSTESPAFSLGTTKVKRKYVRKKGVDRLNNTSPEGVKSDTDSNKSLPKEEVCEKKGINKPEATRLDERSIDAANRKFVRLTRSSYRRTLKFDLESQEKDEGSSYFPSSNRDIESQEENLNADHFKATMQYRQGMEVVMKKTDMGVTYESTCFANQVLNDFQSKPKRHFPNPLPHTKVSPLQDDYTLTDKRVATRGKFQIVFSNVTHDKEETAVQVTVNPDCQLTRNISNDSNCSNRKCLNTERSARTFKRQRVDTAVRAETCSTNATEIFYNSLQTCSYTLIKNSEKNDGSMHFPVFYDNPRTEKGHNTSTCSLQSTMMASGNHENLEKCPLRVTTAALKEWSNRCNYNGFINLTGSPLATKFSYASKIDAITEQLNKLDLMAESNQVSARDQSAILTSHMYYQEQHAHALVPYRRDGAVIHFGNSFDQVKKRQPRPRPKVELDDETIRVWQLLLENINSEGIDGNDEEKMVGRRTKSIQWKSRLLYCTHASCPRAASPNKSCSINNGRTLMLMNLNQIKKHKHDLCPSIS